MSIVSVSVLPHRAARLALIGAALGPAATGAQTVQAGGDAIPSAQEVRYANPDDGTPLGAWLSLPSAPGPHPGVVVLSIAGTEPLVAQLLRDGYAVLLPERRGFVDVEPLLQATFADLAGDARAALDYLRALDEVTAERVSLVAQADDAPPAILAARADPVPLVLLAPPAFSGVESFRLEQRGAARRDRAGTEVLEALDRYIDGIAEIVLGEDPAYVRAYRLEGLRAASPVQLPRSAAFPSDARQMHFFASPLWRDRLAFAPEDALAGLRSPVLVLIGEADANTPTEAYLEAVGRGLGNAATSDATVCLLSGRTRHVFTAEAIVATSRWLGVRRDPSDPTNGLKVPGCGPVQGSEDRMPHRGG